VAAFGAAITLPDVFSGAVARFATGFLADFEDLLAGCLAAFFATDFLAAFFAALLTVFFALPVFFTTRLLFAARFLAAAFLAALARGDLRTFFALRFFDSFFFGVATTNSFMT
jgi:hypothetical protein